MNLFAITDISALLLTTALTYVTIIVFSRYGSRWA